MEKRLLVGLAVGVLMFGIAGLAQATPIAEAGGPYYITPGSTVLLNGSFSYDPNDRSIASYLWDLNNDGTYESSGMTMPFNCPTNVVFGTVYWVNLMVTDILGASDIDNAIINVVNELPPTNPNPNPVPEPATMLLIGTGIAGLAGLRLRRKEK
ncbi:MAG: hypothetical protein A2511_03485 [Deltaproteobacteria bacterium RIFOXYD12_FULL_50_9]|nr:MAG: hypothetical protein A2511_03485 [Deltaproteobacteria bacterium RIFOXYD12_FULL_50_9]